MKVIGIDPGRATGMILLEVPANNSPVPIAYATQEPHTVIDALDHFAREEDGTIAANTWVIVEKFIPREDVHGKDDVAQNINGMITQWGVSNTMLDRVVFQTPDQRVMVTRPVLMRLGLWLAGHKNRHVMDATKHAVSWLVKMRHKMTMAKGWKQ